MISEQRGLLKLCARAVGGVSGSTAQTLYSRMAHFFVLLAEERRIIFQ